MCGRDDEALARSIDYEAASATGGDDTCCQRLENHGFLILASIIYHRCLTIIFSHQKSFCVISQYLRLISTMFSNRTLL